MKGERTILIMAGGTGGHIFPGLAVAEAMRTRHWRIVWLGNAKGMEAELVPKRGIEFRTIAFGGLRGKGLVAAFFLPLNLIRACWQSLRVLREVKPAVVLGLGGYVTFPGGLMTVLLGRPLVLHEQNSIAGLANRVLARIADRALVAFPGALADSVWSGNPVSEKISSLGSPQARYGERSGRLRILVVGGSLGAQVFNQVIPNAFGLMLPEERPTIVHQAGRAHIDRLKANYTAAAVDAVAVAFIEDMADAYHEADLVIARAGAMTVAEIACAGVASILVPYPHAVDDHQTSNARFLSESGAAILVPQCDLNPSGLAALLSHLKRPALAAMGVKARSLGKPDAAERVADACEAVATEIAAACA